jgi:hypothetical protein
MSVTRCNHVTGATHAADIVSGMRRVEHWQRRLDIAEQESDDADRVWRRYMDAMGHTASDPRGNVLWQERERARDRVDQLRVLVQAMERRRGTIQRFHRRSRERIAFVVWHTVMRSQRQRGERVR